MEITYKWKNKKEAQAAAEAIAWNMPVNCPPTITQKGKCLTFSGEDYYGYRNIIHHAAERAGGKEVSPPTIIDLMLKSSRKRIKV